MAVNARGELEEREGKLAPFLVTFPPPEPKDFPSVKLEVEESSENMSPRNMWQVYALGGFLILRWAWARWKERKGRGESSDAAPSS